MTAVLSPPASQEFRNRPAGRNLSVSVFDTPGLRPRGRECVTHWTERREFNSRVLQRVKARKALLCTQLRFLAGYPIMNTITSYLFIYPICSCILRFPSLTKENLTYDTLPDVQERAHLRDVRPAHLIRPIVGLNVCHGITRSELHNYKTNVKPRLFHTNWISSFSRLC